MYIQAEEAAALGVRITLARGSLNLAIEEGGNAVPGSVQDTDEILADCERVIARWHDRREGSMTQVALAPCAPFNATKRLMTETAALAARHDCRMHTHLGETRDEVAYCQERFSCRPVDYFDEVGWMSDRAWVGWSGGNQVRKRLTGGGKRIRTVGSAAKGEAVPGAPSGFSRLQRPSCLFAE
jgi:8-oxoguanine deaminase